MMIVPIENIYFLLCYAWNRLEERDLVQVSAEDCTHLLDLFARVIVHGTSHLLRKGLDRGYLTTSDDLRVLRGRVDMPTSVKRLLLQSGRLHCHYDELSHNVLHNRLLKTTIMTLAHHTAIGKTNHEALALLCRRLQQVDEIELSPVLFTRVQLHRNNAFYGFLLSVCRLIYMNVLAKEGDGDYLFQDFIRNPQQMGTLFQDFVRNFLKLEMEPRKPGSHVVGAEVINWDVLADDVTRAMLPRMMTDISVSYPDRYLVIDTKFYAHTMQHHYESETFQSDHLYQIYAYLRHIESKGPEFRNCTGMLLYPTVAREMDREIQTHGHIILVRTINLNQPWQAIHNRLLAIMEPSSLTTHSHPV